jgi:hypothetical protein
MVVVAAYIVDCKPELREVEGDPGLREVKYVY